MTMRWQELEEGSELHGPVRTLTMRRVNWYAIGFWTICADEPRGVMPNIHTDAEYAQSEGLDFAIGDGMTATNWCSEMLVSYFGEYYIGRPHKLRTKFIKPTPVGAVVSVRGKVKTIEQGGDGERVFDLDVWTENANGMTLTDGDARISVPPDA